MQLMQRVKAIKRKRRSRNVHVWKSNEELLCAKQDTLQDWIAQGMPWSGEYNERRIVISTCFKCYMKNHLWDLEDTKADQLVMMYWSRDFLDKY